MLAHFCDLNCIFINSKEAGINLSGGEYIIHRVYSDQETMKLVTVAQELSGIHPLNAPREIFRDQIIDQNCSN